MRVLVTGATGYVGSRVVTRLQQRGHHVVGLARTDAKGKQLQAQGVEPLIGDLSSLQLLQDAASAADGVIHTAFTHDPSIPPETAVDIDIKVTQALVAGLAGTGKPLILTSGTGVLGDTGNILVDEEFPAAGIARINAEREALLGAGHNVRVVLMRLPLYVYGHGGSTFVPVQLYFAKQLGKVFWVGPPDNKVSAVHVDDVAAAYVMALENPQACGVFHVAGEHGITAQAVAQALAQNLGLPAPESLTAEQAESVGWLPMWIRHLVSHNNQTSSAKAERILGWSPTPRKGMLHDIVEGSYKQLQ